jgi:hypothetical protein
VIISGVGEEIKLKLQPVYFFVTKEGGVSKFEAGTVNCVNFILKGEVSC